MGDSTRWSIVDDAVRDAPGGRERFARCYAPVVRAYLSARWRGGALRTEIDDAVQEVFALCFKQDGPLDRAEPGRGSGFRAYLCGVCRNVARGFERRAKGRRELPAGDGLEVAADDATLSRVFDRQWAMSLLREAARLMRARAVTHDGERRVEILELRFQEGLPIRDIAGILEMEPSDVHVAYARARREFKRSLCDVVQTALDLSDQEADAECMKLLGFLA